MPMGQILKILLCVFLAVIAIGIMRPQKQQFDKTLKYNNKSIQKEIVGKLAQENIPYRQTDDGYIKYPSTYNDELAQIEKGILEKPSVWLQNKYTLKSMKADLESRGIKYTTKKLEKENLIVIEWQEENDNIVKDIVQQETHSSRKSPER